MVFKIQMRSVQNVKHYLNPLTEVSLRESGQATGRILLLKMPYQMFKSGAVGCNE